MKWFKEWWPYLVAVVVVLVIKFFIVTPIRVNGPSMQPTLHEGNILLLNELVYRFEDPRRFDMVVFDYKDSYLIKRIVALPGETVEVKEGVLLIDGEALKEDFDHAQTDDFGPVEVPKNHYFVLGDNRLDSTDSRVIGAVDKKKFRGRVGRMILPLSHFGKEI